MKIKSLSGVSADRGLRRKTYGMYNANTFYIIIMT